MADKNDKYPDNAAGRYYVDTNCIDCELCRTTAPDHFAKSEQGDYSIVHAQPADEAQIALCEEALAECPVEAIGNDAEDAAPPTPDAGEAKTQTPPPVPDDTSEK